MNNHVSHYQHKLLYEIDSWDLNESLERGEKTVVIDARSTNAFAKERIPAAINIPHREMHEDSTSHLDKNNLYVTYCDGIGCNASTKGALNMSRLGFNVKELIGGLEWWKRDGYSTDSDSERNSEGG